MKFSYEKKFKKKDITSVCSNDPKMLQVLLFNAERNWAHGMEIKQKMVEKQNNRAKHHIRRKFRRAVNWAAQLHKST